MRRARRGALNERACTNPRRRKVSANFPKTRIILLYDIDNATHHSDCLACSTYPIPTRSCKEALAHKSSEDDNYTIAYIVAMFQLLGQPREDLPLHGMLGMG
jgi:hypothetical protein